MAQGDGLHLRRDRHLQIERQAALAGQDRQGLDVRVGDVSAILAQMGGDAVGAGFDRKKRGADWIGRGAAAGVADGCDMVDVDAEPERCHRVDSPFGQEFVGGQAAPAIARLPGFTAGSAASSGGSASGA
jgi:hypothetical protein